MPIQSLLRFQDYQFQVSLAGGAWRWTTRIDVSKSVLKTEIRDVISPYGLLRDSVPIPGEVVEAMADSIQEVLQAYTPSILLSVSSVTFVVDEGRGVSAPIAVQVTNNGVLGSLLSATVTSSVAYVFPIPASVNGLTANQSGQFELSADSTNLLAAGSPYVSSLMVQGTNATNSPQVVPVTVIVRPKATIDVTPTTLTFNVAKPLSGAFPAIPSQQFDLDNIGLPTSVLDYQIRKLTGVPWMVSVSPVYGSVNGGSTQPITVVVAPPEAMGVGTYTETLRISGYSSNQTVDVVVTLNIT